MLETAHHECGNRAVDDIKRYRFIISLIMRSYYNYGCPEAWTRTELCPPPFENVKATYYIHFNFNILDCIQKPKSLPPYTFHGLKLYLNVFVARAPPLDPVRVAYSVTRLPSWI